MLHSISLSHFYPNKYETAVMRPIHTTALIESTNERVPCELIICLEGCCSAKGYLLKEGRRECRVEFQFPLLFKNRLEKVFKKGNFVAKVVMSPGSPETTILHLFSDKLVKDAEVYVNYLNVDNNTTALSINNEADCALENSELIQPFLLFLLKCSIPNKLPQESFLQPLYSIIQNSDAPHASRNAIAILSRIGYSFFRENLEGINISGARLEGTLLYGAKLDHAKMTGASIEDVCLHQVSLINAKMDGIDTSRKPSLIHDSEISNWSISPDERYVAVCTKDGKVYVWDVEKFTLHSEIRLLPYMLHNPMIFQGVEGWKQPHIKFIKFIDKTQLILITKSGSIVLWSLCESRVLDHKSTTISYTRRKRLFHARNKKSKIRNIFCTNKPNSHDFLSLVLCYPVEYMQKPQRAIKSAYEIWGVTGNAIIPLKKENFLETGLYAGLPFQVSTEFKSQTTILTCTQNSQVCLSPRGWIACLVTENLGSSLTLMQTPHIDLSVKFLIPDFTHWCNFSQDDLWLIGVTKINQEYCVVKWCTTQLYLIQPAATPTMEMPRPDTLFTTKDVIERCDLIPDSPNCVYSTGSIIYVRNLSNHDIIYQVGIPELHDFKIISKANLLLTNRVNNSILETRKLNALVNAPIQTAHTDLKVGYFTPGCQEMIMIPRDQTLLQWIMQTDDIKHASKNLFSSNLSNLKIFLNLKHAHKKNLKEPCLFSPHFKYMLLLLPNTVDICIWNIFEDKLHCVIQEELYFLLNNSFEEGFISIYNHSEFISTAQEFFKIKTALSDELSLVIANPNQGVVIYDLSDPNSIKCLYRCTNDEVSHVRLSKCATVTSTVFVSSNHIISQYDYVNKKKLVRFRSHASILSFEVSYDNRLLVSSDDKSIRLWDIETGNELDKEDTPFPLSDLKFASNNRFIASFSEQEGVTYLWEVNESKLRLILLHPKQLGCRGANFKGVTLSELNQQLFDQLQEKNDL